MGAYNLNYPDYSQNYGSYSPTPQPKSGMEQFLSYASPISSIAGIGLQAYGSYKQNEALEKQYELQKEQFNAEQDRLLRQEEEQRRQRELQNALGYGDYATGQANDAMSSYGSYASRIGA